MKIEDITKTSIKKIDGKELFSLRLRFLQIWDKHFKEVKKFMDIDRGTMLNKYQILIKEMGERKLVHDTKEIDKALLTKSLYGIDIPGLKEEVLIKDYVSIFGDYLKNPKTSKEVSVAVIDKPDIVEQMEKKIGDIIKIQLKKKCKIVWKAEGAGENYMPVFDVILRPKETTSRVEISKPETTEKYHHIPVNSCKITATLDISEKDGIKALYCGGEGDKKIATYLFDVNKFTMATAKAWVKKQETKKSETVKEEKPKVIKDDDVVNKIIPIFKIDEEKRIIGGVVYAPDEIDSQGDTASAEEIEKACHKFNVEVRKFKVNHKGVDRDIDLLESYIMPADVIINNEKIKKGSWFTLCKVNEDEVWAEVKSGDLTGFSMRGWANAF
jgi:hypothetical protein